MHGVTISMVSNCFTSIKRVHAIKMHVCFTIRGASMRYNQSQNKGLGTIFSKWIQILSRVLSCKASMAPRYVYVVPVQKK